MNRSTGAPLGLIALLALLCAVFTLLLPGSFATLGTLQSVLLQIPELGLLALAQMLPLVSGGINLAVVASANMAGLAMAWVLVGGLSALGLDLSQQMLNIARSRVARAGLAGCELRHGDIFGTGLPGESADLVVVHQVLHYLGDPAAALKEAGRLVAEGGRLLIVDFAPHALEFLREQHQHRRLGFSEAEMDRWLAEAGLAEVSAVELPPAREAGLTVKIWTAVRPTARQRSAA